MSFTQNDWGQCDIINIPTNYQNYPSTAILKHANVLAEVNESPYVRLHKMTHNDVQYYNPRSYNDHHGH